MMKIGDLKSQIDGDVLQELASVLGSHEFHGSHRAQTLLRYLVENALSHRSDQLKERTIGIELFHRDAAYDTGHDGIVRVAASDVRKRLMNFYSRTVSTRMGPGIRIVLPAGSYVPLFERYDAAGPPPKELREQPPVAAGRESRQNLWVGLILLGVAIGVAFALVSASQNAAKPAVDGVLAEAWGPFTRADANVLLSTATPLSLVMVPEGYGSSTHAAPPEAYPLFRQHRPLVPGAKLNMSFSDNLLGVGTMSAVVTAVNTLRSMGSSYQILPEGVSTLSELRGRNAILFGAPVDSEAITRTMEHTPLLVDYEPSVKGFVIRDRTSGKMILPPKRRLRGFHRCVRLDHGSECARFRPRAPGYGGIFRDHLGRHARRSGILRFAARAAQSACHLRARGREWLPCGLPGGGEVHVQQSASAGVRVPFASDHAKGVARGELRSWRSGLTQQLIHFGAIV